MATATITCTTTGATAADSVQLEVEELEEFEIVYRSFIPFNNLEVPLFPRCGGIPGQQLFFKGDDRGFSTTSSDFRTQSKVTVIPEESCDDDGLKDGTDLNSVGETRSYAEDALADGHGLGSLLHDAQAAEIYFRSDLRESLADGVEHLCLLAFP